MVRDNGIGIAPEDQDRVFGMFVQLNRDMRRSQTGLGIGLTLVKQMTELHGGSVAVWSEGLGKGTEFTIDLPLAVAVEQPAANEPADPQSFAKWTILVVDDSQDGADSLSFLLTAGGHTCAHGLRRPHGPFAWRRNGCPTWCCSTSACLRCRAMTWRAPFGARPGAAICA